MRSLAPEHVHWQEAGLESAGLLFEAHRVFTLADRDRNNTLDMHELSMIRNVLMGLNPDLFPAPLTPQFAESVMGSVIDTDRSGDIDRVEWIAFVTKHAKLNGERSMLRMMRMIATQLEKGWMPH